MKAAIARHLQVQESQIKSVEEWAHVLFVVVAGLGARFVSKKVVMNATKMYLEENGSLTIISTNKVATARNLIGRNAQAFLKNNFTPGSVVEVEEGCMMLDKAFNAMKPGYHLQNPVRAKELAGVK